MKNLYKIIICCLPILLLSACEEDLAIFDADNGQTALAFAEASITIDVCSPTTEIVIESTTRSSSDRLYNFSISSESNAESSEYTLTSTSITIPAGDFTGSTTVEIDFSEIPDGVSRNLILDIEPSDGTITPDRSQTVINYQSACTLNVVEINYTADNFPEENTLLLVNTDTSEIFLNITQGEFNDNNSFVLCLPPGNYEITVGDPGFGDGFEPGAGVSGNLVECSGNTSLFADITGDIDVGNPVVRTFTLN